MEMLNDIIAPEPVMLLPVVMPKSPMQEFLSLVEMKEVLIHK